MIKVRWLHDFGESKKKAGWFTLIPFDVNNQSSFVECFALSGPPKVAAGGAKQVNGQLIQAKISEKNEQTPSLGIPFPRLYTDMPAMPYEPCWHAWHVCMHL